MIKVKNLSKVYENNAIALRNVSFTIDKGEFVFIVGTSGSGKSTLIKSMLKETEISEGTIIINGFNINKIRKNKIPYLRRNIGVVFQDFRLLPNKTVFENVAFAMEVIGSKKREIRRNVPQVLAMVGLHKKLKAYPSQLSGGEQQRVALARAIINKPPILLADEPTGNLDPSNAMDIMHLLNDINKRGTTVIVASHAKEIVDAMEKRVIAIENGKLVKDSKGGYNYNV